MKKTIISIAILSVCWMMGCTLTEIPEGAESCPVNQEGEVQRVYTKDKVCTADNFESCLTDEEKSALKSRHCPMSASRCMQAKDKSYYCITCNEGEQTSLCEGQCIDPKTDERYCGASDTCEGYQVCNTNQECKDGTCVCKDGSENCELTTCTEGETRCETSEGMSFTSKCNGLAFEFAGICPNNASCKGDACGECKNDTTVCEMDAEGKAQLKTCKNGTYESQACPNDMPCMNEFECAECASEATTCTDLEGVGQLTKCLNGKPMTEACPGQMPCADASACSVCNVEDPQTCTDDPELNVGIVKQCKEGVIEQSLCTQSCKDNACGECINGQQKCENGENGVGQMKVCQNGTWTNDLSCETKSCNAEGTGCGTCLNTAQETCVIGEDGIGSLTACVNGEQHIQTCPGKAPCAENACSVVCVDGSITCTNDAEGKGTRHVCSDNQLTSSACDNGNMCNGDDCGTCSAKDNQCVNDATSFVGNMQTCVNGTKSSVPCDNQASCNAAGTCGECNDKQAAQCENGSDGYGILTTCKEGKPVISKSSNASCNADKTNFGECLNGQTTCTSTIYLKTTYKECQNGAWVDVPCTNSCTADGKCGDCGGYTNSIKCENNTAYSCSNGEWVEGQPCSELGCAGKVCAECQAGEFKCRTYGNIAYLTECTNGTFPYYSPTQTSCPSNACNADNTGCAPVE